MSKGKKHFSRVKTIKAAINVVPSRKTHEIQANSDQRQKIIMVFLAAQCSKLKKKLVLISKEDAFISDVCHRCLCVICDQTEMAKEKEYLNYYILRA